MVGHRGAGEPVDPCIDAFKRCCGNEPFERGTRNPSSLRLLARDQPPLVFSNVSQAKKRRSSHSCIAFYIR